VHGCLHLQLGGTFWRARDSHHGQGDPVHFCPVVVCLHEPGDQARAHHGLPSTQSNGMVERVHRQLKDALCARGAGPAWHSHLPWVVLGLRAVPKEDSAVSSAELVTGTPLVLPGQLLHVPDPPRVDVPRPPTRLLSYAAAANTPPAQLAQADHVYVRVGGQQKPLAAPYAGPYLVVSKGAKTFTIQGGQRQEIVSVDRLKPHTGLGPVFPAEAASRGRPPRMPALLQSSLQLHEAADWGGLLWRIVFS
jgi:hypothetical protein